MDSFYALGVSCNQYTQIWFRDFQEYFEFVNDLSNPYYVMEYLFPFISILDSVFASQLLLCWSVGSWLNTVMKWWFLEERPYWWVRETDYYNGFTRPHLHQYRQTCETGPGSPSGHTMNMAMLLMLVMMWTSHVMNDRRYYLWWWKYVAYALLVGGLLSVMLARVYVAAHFPHQCLLGALVGLLLAPALCIYVSDPYIWKTYVSPSEIRSAMAYHVFSSCVMMAIAVVTYYGLIVCGIDPNWTIDLATRWCYDPSHIHVSTTPLFSLVTSSASVLGWAVCVTPALAKYRHYTANRSVILATLASGFFVYTLKLIQQYLPYDNPTKFHVCKFVLYTVKPALFLKLVPFMATWPYSLAVATKSKRKSA